MIQVKQDPDNRIGEARRRLKSGIFKAQAIVERRNAADTEWIILDDVDSDRGIDWGKSSKKYKYGEFSRIPPASDIRFNLLNKNGKYSEGSGTELEGVIDIDTKVRLRAGYILEEAEEPIEGSEIISEAYTFHTTASGGEIILSAANVDGNSVKHFSDLFDTFGDVEYTEDPDYLPAAYTVFTKDFLGQGFSDPRKLRITCNSDKGTIYYRAVENLDAANQVIFPSTSWTNGGSTEDGTVEIDLPASSRCRYFQIGVIWDGISWSSDVRIQSVKVFHLNYIDWVYTDVFYLDTPSFSDPNAPAIPDISCSGRDIWKRAQEIDINVPDLSAGFNIDDLIKLIADQVGIQYSADSIADLSAFGARTLAEGLKDTEKAANVFEKCMQFINQSGSEEYRIFLKYDDDFSDNILYVQPRFEDYETDFVFNFRHYTGIGARRKNYDKQLLRATAYNEKPQVEAEELLDQETGSSSVGVRSFSWGPDAIFKRIEFTTSDGGYRIDGILSWNFDGATIFVSSTGAGGTYDLKIYGCEIEAGFTGVVNEWISARNIVERKGITTKIENQFIETDTEAQAICKSLVEDFEVPVKEAQNLKYPYLNLQLNLNDLALIWSRQLFLDDIHNITGISFHWDRSQKPSDSTSFNLDDVGRNFIDINPDGFIYDTVLKYDIGYVYDMRFGPQGDAEEARASVTYQKNIGTVDQ